MFGLFLKAVIAAMLWALANVVYYDMKKKGVRNFGRFAAFWVGTPTTWITLFVVEESEAPTFEVSDEEQLLAEVRMDRARRIAGRGGTADPLAGGKAPELRAPD